MILREEGKKFTPAPEGLHQAVCVDVVELGEEEVIYQGKSHGHKFKIRLVWQIDELMDNGKRFIVSKKYTASLHEKAALRKDLDSWRGRSFTKEELAGFDLETIIGANCMIQVIHHVTDEGKTFANVQTITVLPKRMAKIAADDAYVRVKDRTPEGQTPAAPAEEEEVPF